jgi:cytoskeletal protein RodZ
MRFESVPEDRYQDLTLLRADLSRLGQRLVSPARFDETVPPSTPASGARAGGTPKRGLDLSSVMRRRAAQIATHLEAAERAFERADLDAALAACEEAALLDPDEPRTMALIDRVRQAIEDRQVREFLAAAREELDHGSLTGARDLVTQALQMRPDSSEAAELQRAVVARFEAVERERQRQQQIDTCVSRARAALQVFAYEMAARSAAEALELDEDHREAKVLRQQAREALEAQRREEAEERARALVAEAERRAATDTLDAAVAWLEGAGNDHALVVAALDGLRREQAARAARRADEEWVASHLRRATDATAAGEFALARQALDAGATRAADLPDALASLDRARRDLEVAEAAAARAHAIAGHLASAREALAAERWDEAQDHVTQALAVEAGHAAALALREEIEGARVAAEARRRQAAVEAHLALAREALAAERWDEAQDHVTQALAVEAGHAAALALREEIEGARVAAEARRRQAAVEAHLALAREALAAERWDEAQGHVTQALAVEAGHAAALALREEIEGARVADEARRQQAALDRRADKEIEKAQQAFARGRHRDALARLQRFDPPHERVTEALGEFTGALAALEAENARRQAEAEARAKAEADALAREAASRDLSLVLSQIQGQLARREFDAAAQSIAEAESRLGPSPALTLLKARREALLHPEEALDLGETLAVPGAAPQPQRKTASPDETVFMPQPPPGPRPRKPETVPPATSAPVAAPPVVRTPPPTSDVTVPPPARRRPVSPLVLVVAAAAVILLLALVYWFTRSTDPIEDAQPEPTTQAALDERGPDDAGERPASSETPRVSAPADPPSSGPLSESAESRPSPAGTSPVPARPDATPVPTPVAAPPTATPTPATTPALDRPAPTPAEVTPRPPVPTPAPARVEPTPAPPPQAAPRRDDASAVDETPAVRAALGRWRAAYENLSVEQMAAAWTSLSPAQTEQFRTAFEACRSYTVTTQNESISIDTTGRAATVSARVRYECVTRAGGRRVPTTSDLVISLQKAAGDWRIASIATR